MTASEDLIPSHGYSEDDVARDAGRNKWFTRIAVAAAIVPRWKT